VRLLPSERQLRYPIIGYLRGIKGIFRTENSRNPVFGFRLLGKGAILQRSRPFCYWINQESFMRKKQAVGLLWIA
ncbi:TPA: hypothetical protein ACFP41_001929, partial [Neisseria weaveri]